MIFGCLCGSLASNAQTAEWWEMADSLYHIGAFRQAAVTYERIVFLAEVEGERSQALLKKAYAEKQIGRQDAAMIALKRIPLYGIPDTLQAQAFYERILGHYLMGAYQEALYEWERMHHFLPDSLLSPQVRLLEILTLNELRQWDSAKVRCTRYLAEKGDSLSVSDIYPKTPTLKNPKKAARLSLILPGAGQLYAGKPLAALSNLVLQGGSVWFTVVSFSSGHFLSGIGTGAPMWLRFYLGGAKNARFLVNKTNAKRSSAYNTTIRNTLINLE